MNRRGFLFVGIVAFIYLTFSPLASAEQLYQNREFGFRVKFPDGWELWELKKPKNSRVIVRVDNPQSGCSLNIWARKQKKPESLENYSTGKIDNLAAKIFQEEISKKHNNAQLLDFGNTSLGRRKTGWLVYTCTDNTCAGNRDMKTAQFFTDYRGIDYLLTFAGPATSVDRLIEVYISVMMSFSFEDRRQ
jgi:hypothetical protein